MKQSLLLTIIAVYSIAQAVASPTLGNYLDITVQLSGDTTNTPSAAPTNTTKITVSTSTAFKGRLEADPTTGVTRITDANPAGTYPVTVTAFDGAGATTVQTFTLTVTTPLTCNPVTFATAANVTVGSSPLSVAVGDFNRDGKQDLAVVNQGANNVSILLGDGVGGFGAPTNFAVGSNPISVAVGDFNGDGKQDLAVANLSSANVSILLGDGAGGFSAASNFAVSFGPTAVAVGDFNGDGKQDLAFAVGSNVMAILLGNGDGSFGAATTFGSNVNSDPEAIAVGDFNGDGKQDIAVANGAFGSSIQNVVSIFLGDGAGGFAAATTFPVGDNPRSVTVGDFNGDGKQDLAVANSTSGNVSILLGNGAGGFAAATNFAAGSGAISVTVGDFNGDGKQDLATANNAAGTVSILLGDGAGGFGAAANFGVGSNPFSVAVGDFNGDGKQDLVTANLQSANVSVLLRGCTSPSPTPTPIPSPSPSRLQNISTRGLVGTGDNVMIGGFTINGTSNKTILLRAIGPSLANPPFNLTGTLQDPTLSLFSGSTRIGLNDNWADDANSSSIPQALQPTSGAESAILMSLAPGAYTAIMSGVNGGTGIGLVEAYDMDQPTPTKLVNISTRGMVQTGDNVLIGGIIIQGQANERVVVRAIGPSLRLPPFNIANALANPTLSFFNVNGTRIAFNDDWRSDQQAELLATGLQPTDDLESAIVITLPPGNYTGIVRGANDTTGVGLVEVFESN
jgi:hypothetical protein